MTAAWVPLDHRGLSGPSVRPPLRLVTNPGDAGPREPRSSRADRVPVEVRRRRTLLAALGILLVGLALPLAGTGGHSHATGSLPAGSTVYTVQPGDTLWAIAARIDPSADPRPLVARLAAEIGSDRVVPGEHLVVR